MASVPYTSNSSVLNLFTTQVMPVALSIVNPNRTSVPSIAIANSGSQRFDLYSVRVILSVRSQSITH